jgi:chain length determinant protein EpsF
MNMTQFLSILRARWAAALLVFVLTVGVAIGVSMILPKQYTAMATLLVDQNRADPIAGNDFRGNPSPAFIATQVDVLKSERVARLVAKKLGWVDDAEVRAQWMKATNGVGAIEAWLTVGLLKAVDIKPSRESNVISVSYVADDPVEAANVANTFVQSYLDVTLELRVDPAKQYSSFFDTRGKELRANLERAQAKLSGYQRDKGVIIANDGQLDAEQARLNELSTQLVALQAITAESSSRQFQAQSGAGDRLQDVINNPVIGALRGDLTRAEARLQELSARLGDNHPQVIEAKATISSLRGRLDVETRRVTGSVGVTNSINRQREIEVRAALEAQRSRVMKLRSAREEGAVLVRDLEAAQRAYDAVVTRLNQTSLESQTTQSNANVLAPAVPQYLPSSPKIGRNVVLAVVVGLVLAIGAAMLLEFVDRRVHTEDEVSELLGLPLLGVLPSPGGKGRFAGRAKPLVISPNRLLHRLPSPTTKEA